MDKVIIKDLLVRGIIGIDDWERTKPQDILINVVMFADLRRAGETDNIDDCINYQPIAKKIYNHTEEARRFTVEALAADIAKICLEEAGVEKVRVRIEKPGAIRFAGSAGVEIERSK